MKLFVTSLLFVLSATAAMAANIVCRDGQYYHADPANKCRFYQCGQYGHVYNMPCSAGLKWDQASHACAFKLQPGESCPNTIIPTCNGVDYYYADPADACKFYQCDEFRVIHSRPCPVGEKWDQAALTCVEAQPGHACSV